MNDPMKMLMMYQPLKYIASLFEQTLLVSHAEPHNDSGKGDQQHEEVRRHDLHREYPRTHDLHPNIRPVMVVLERLHRPPIVPFPEEAEPMMGDSEESYEDACSRKHGW